MVALNMYMKMTVAMAQLTIDFIKKIIISPFVGSSVNPAKMFSGVIRLSYHVVKRVGAGGWFALVT